MPLLWWLILTVNLIEFRTSLETHVQVSLMVESSAGEETSPWNVFGTIPWARVPDWIKRRKRSEDQRSHLSPSRLWMSCDQPHSPAARLPAVMGSVPQTVSPNKPSLKLLLSMSLLTAIRKITDQVISASVWFVLPLASATSFIYWGANTLLAGMG